MKNTIRIQNLNVEVKTINGVDFIPESEAFRIQNSKRKGRQQDMEKICNFNEKATIGGRVFHKLLLKADKRESLIKCSSTIASLGL